jgi:hypothetical protein
MTEAEAIKFLRSCERFWLWRKNLTAGEVIRRIRRSCFSMIGITLFILYMASFHLANLNGVGFGHYFNIFLLAYCFSMSGLSIWLLIRLRQIRRVLGYSQIINHKS